MTNPVRPFPIVTVGGMVLAPDGTFLLVKSHKWHHMYTIPGGKVDLGETCADAVVRELKEETNLDVGNVRFVHLQESIFNDQFYRPSHFVMHDYVVDLSAEHAKDDVRLNEEAQEYLWVRPEEARELPINKELIHLLDHLDVLKGEGCHA